MKKKKGNKTKDNKIKDTKIKDTKIKEPINLTINVSMKQVIPKAMREQVWIKHIGRKFESRCYIQWCKNTMTVFDFHVGHDIPESKGGETHIDNLRPICSRCNLSMSNKYTIKEWNDLNAPKSWWKSCFSILS